MDKDTQRLYLLQYSTAIRRENIYVWLVQLAPPPIQ